MLWGFSPFAARDGPLLVIKDLGTLTGEVLLFGGPYSNFQATMTLMDWADRADIPPDSRICTGDLVAYCADAVAVLNIVRARGGPVVAGNCEIQLAQTAVDCGCGFAADSACSVLAKDWYAYANRVVGADDRAFMAGLPDWVVFSHSGKRYAVIHGGAFEVSKFLWPTSQDTELLCEINAIRADLGVIDGVICGHSGIAFSRHLDGVQWINAGVIGMPPHDGHSSTWFAVLGHAGVRFERLEYDHNAASAAMVAVGLTQGYHLALTSGYWPSEDILPLALRRKNQSRASG